MEASNQKAERELVNTLERVLKAPDGFSVMHVYMSRLLASNRDDNKVAVVMHTFEKLTSYDDSYLFKLENQDVLLIARNVKVTLIEELTADLRSMFTRDPAITDNPAEYFIRKYNLKTEYKLFLAEIKRIFGETKKQDIAQPIPVNPENLADVMEILKKANLFPFIRKQEVIAITPQGKFGVYFQEFFTSINEIGKKMAPNINFLSDSWLFQHLTETLDLKMLMALPLYDKGFVSSMISLNLNVDTLMKPEFKIFSDIMKERGIHIIAELQVRDIINSAALFKEAKDLLHENENKVLLDGVSQNSLHFLHPEAFECDFVKIVWSDLFKNETNTEKMEEFMSGFNGGKVVLCRCDDETALKWGVARKVMFFQGNVVDKMLAGASKLPVWNDAG